MTDVTRRNFLQHAGVGMAVGWALPALTGIAQTTSGDRVRHAVIGLGGQGRTHLKTLLDLPEGEVVAVCDVDTQRRQNVMEKLPDPSRVMETDDYRRILDDKHIDSVSIATPDHWHTPIALEALAAGKHVYVEKPCAHNIHEAQVLQKAAAESGKCVQHGTQARSSASIYKAVEFMRSGGLGTVRMAKAINHQLRPAIGREPETDPPAGVNYDRWVGPAPYRPFTQNRFHYNWHWFWDYGCGDLGNDGIHQVDQARWGLGVGLPKAVSASGGQLFYDDDHETPDTQVVTFEYDHCYLLYEMRLWTNYTLEGHENGVVFYGDKGILEIGRKGCEATLIGGEKKAFGPYIDIHDHFRNFLECVKAGNPSGLNGGIGEGVTSAILCHLGNIATRVGRKLYLEPDSPTCIGDAEANKLFRREYRKGYEFPGLL